VLTCVNRAHVRLISPINRTIKASKTLKNNNKFRWKRTATGVSIGLLLMCNTARAQVETPPVIQDQNTFTLNLKNTDIHSLISTVSKQTGRNFVVDPRVKAKVTVISTDPVSADGLYEVFLSVLQVHGYSAVPAGDLIKIVPDVTAKQGPVPILGEDPDPSDQLVTQVIAVVNVPAAQLVPILRPMVPQQGHLAAYAATNSLIVTDRASNIQRLMEIIRRIDRPDNEEIEVVRLNHAAASEIVGTLNSLQRNNIGGPQGPGAIQLVADDRTNSVLISGDRAARVRVRGLIAHLDTPIESGGNTRVVYLKFANAEDMVTILQGVSQGQAAVGATTTDAGGATQNFTPQVQQQVQPTQNAQNIAQRQAQQNNNAVTPRSAAETGESNVDIQADANTNSLIITAPPDEMQNILAVIRQLDIRRAQVLVEAVIAEITEDNTREFGINFLLDGTDKDVPVGFTNLGGATDSVLGIAGAQAAGTLPSSLGSGLSLALGRFATGEIDFGFLVRAIASDADNNILSTPSIVTLDNEEAEIVVGSNVPFVTGQQLSANNNNPFQTIERRDIGLTLKVKPQINDGNTIKMELEQEVSNVNTTALTGAADITTNVRSIKTTVLVEDGQTLVLGGLIDDQVTDVEEKVPLLGDIPVLGRLFRYSSTQKSKRNLMVFLHPLIMRDSDTADQYSNTKYNFIRSRQLLYRQEQDNSLSKERQKLPELKLYFEGRDVGSPLTQLDAPVPPSPSEVVATPALENSSTVQGLTTSVKTVKAASPKRADIEQVIATYNAQQADEIISADTVSFEETVTVDDRPALPPIEMVLADSLNPAAIAPATATAAAITTVVPQATAPVKADKPEQADQKIAELPQADEPKADETVREIPASSKAVDGVTTIDGVSLVFGVVEDTDTLVEAELLPMAEVFSDDELKNTPAALPKPVSHIDHIDSNVDVEDTDALVDDAEELIADEPNIAPAIEKKPTPELLVQADTLPEAELLPLATVISEDELLDTPAATPAPVPYVDNIDSDIVDRSQDDLSDDRPEVVILSITVKDESANDISAVLPEMQRVPRY